VVASALSAGVGEKVGGWIGDAFKNPICKRALKNSFKVLGVHWRAAEHVL
jgi:hypothetical protein